MLLLWVGSANDTVETAGANFRGLLFSKDNSAGIGVEYEI